MKYKYLLLLLFTLLTATQSMAQRRLTKSGRASADTALIVKQYADSLALLKQQLEEVRRVNDSCIANRPMGAIIAFLLLQHSITQV